MKKPIILIISLLLLSTMAWSIDMVRSRRYTTKDCKAMGTKIGRNLRELTGGLVGKRKEEDP